MNKLKAILTKFLALSFYQKVKFIIKLGAYVVIFLDVMDYALEKFKAVNIDLPDVETKEVVTVE
jgi:hypothetical protein